MANIESYRQRLLREEDWIPFLLKHSGLPGPRGNLELARAFAQEASPQLIRDFAKIGPEDARENTPRAYLAFCGTLGLGRLVLEGNTLLYADLRTLASDPRWRIREAVAMAMQIVGEADPERLWTEVRVWSQGNWYEMRAAAAAVCEPRLLRTRTSARRALQLLNRITRSMLRAKDRRDEAFLTLRQGMAYCWSVAVAAEPKHGKPMMERWLTTQDPDVRWMLKENLWKNRLARMDPEWVEACKARLGA